MNQHICIFKIFHQMQTTFCWNSNYFDEYMGSLYTYAVTMYQLWHIHTKQNKNNYENLILKTEVSKRQPVMFQLLFRVCS